MLLVDTLAGRVIGDEELKERYARRNPYGEWLDRNLVRLRELPIPNKKVEMYTSSAGLRYRRPLVTPMRM